MTVAATSPTRGRRRTSRAFLARLLHYDRAAAVRLQAGGTALAVFGRPPSFEVLAIRTVAAGQAVRERPRRHARRHRLGG